MPDRPMIIRDELVRAFAAGCTLIQEEWDSPAQIALIDALIAEGKAEVVDPWEYLDTFQCERRRVRGIRSAP